MDRPDRIANYIPNTYRAYRAHRRLRWPLHMPRWLEFGPGTRVRVGSWIIAVYREPKVARRKRRVAA